MLADWRVRIGSRGRKFADPLAAAALPAGDPMPDLKPKIYPRHGSGYFAYYDVDEVNEQLALLRAEVKHWQTCSNCGQQMSAPGICDAAVNEKMRGLELMHEQTLARAEQAESMHQQDAAQIAALTAQLQQAEAWRDDAKATNDRWADEVAKNRELTALLASHAETIRQLSLSAVR